MFTKKQVRIILVVLIIATVAFIWFNSSQSREESAELSGGLLDIVADFLEIFGIIIDRTNDHFIRKLAHFAEFGLLGTELMLYACLYFKPDFQSMSNCAFIALMIAVTDETIQIFSNRGSQVQDVVLDFSGAVAGILFITILNYIIKRSRS